MVEMLLAELVVMIGGRHLSASLYLVLQCIVKVLLELYSVRVTGDSWPPNRGRQLHFEASSELGLVAALLLCLTQRVECYQPTTCFGYIKRRPRRPSYSQLHITEFTSLQYLTIAILSAILPGLSLRLHPLDRRPAEPCPFDDLPRDSNHVLRCTKVDRLFSAFG